MSCIAKLARYGGRALGGIAAAAAVAFGLVGAAWGQTGETRSAARTMQPG